MFHVKHSHITFLMLISGICPVKGCMKKMEANENERHVGALIHYALVSACRDDQGVMMQINKINWQWL